MARKQTFKIILLGIYKSGALTSYLGATGSFWLLKCTAQS